MTDPERQPIETTEEYQFTSSRSPSFELHEGPGLGQVIFDSRDDEEQRTKLFPPISED